MMLRYCVLLLLATQALAAIQTQQSQPRLSIERRYLRREVDDLQKCGLNLCMTKRGFVGQPRKSMFKRACSAALVTLNSASPLTSNITNDRVVNIVTPLEYYGPSLRFFVMQPPPNPVFYKMIFKLNLPCESGSLVIYQNGHPYRSFCGVTEQTIDILVTSSMPVVLQLLVNEAQFSPLSAVLIPVNMDSECAGSTFPTIPTVVTQPTTPTLPTLLPDDLLSIVVSALPNLLGGAGTGTPPTLPSDFAPTLASGSGGSGLGEAITDAIDALDLDDESKKRKVRSVSLDSDLGSVVTEALDALDKVSKKRNARSDLLDSDLGSVVTEALDALDKVSKKMLSNKDCDSDGNPSMDGDYIPLNTPSPDDVAALTATGGVESFASAVTEVILNQNATDLPDTLESALPEIVAIETNVAASGEETNPDLPANYHVEGFQAAMPAEFPEESKGSTEQNSGEDQSTTKSS